MKGTLIILCLSIGLMGCGKLRSQRFLKTGGGSGALIAGLEQPPQLPLLKDDLEKAQIVCNALFTKSTNIKAALVATKEVHYSFTLAQKKACNNAAIETSGLATQITIGANDDLEFSAIDTSIFFPDVITEKSIAIAAICTEALDKTTTIDQKVLKKISNATFLLNKIYLVKFGIDDKKFYTIQINTLTSSTTGAFNPHDTQLISIITDVSQDGSNDPRNIGAEKERIQYAPCPVKNQLKFQRETFLRSFFTTL